MLLSAIVTAGTGILLATHPAQVRATLSQLMRLPVSALVGAFGMVLGQLTLQSLRQWAVVPRDLALGPVRVAYAFLWGEWLNILAPARTGDALKVVLIRRESGKSLGGVPSAIGAVLADKVVDGVSLVLLCAAAGSISLLWARAHTRLFAASVAAAAVLAVVAATRLRSSSREKHWTWMRDLRGGFSGLRDGPRVLASLVFGLASWVAEGVALWLLCAGLGVAPTPSEILLALVVLNVGISVPISFANLGVYEAALASGLGYAGVALPTALAVAASHHGVELLAQNVAVAGLSLSTRAPRLINS
ncbi:MAG: lysylphosphatidylglycerol synthase transmembrane domain-containing protein [Polyangiaceae bacterium]